MGLNSGTERTDVRHRLEAFHLQPVAEDRLNEYSNPHQRL